MNAVGYGPNWDFLPWPAGEQGLENLSAHFPMELADAIDLPAAADREISHVEGFRIVFRILPSRGEQVIHRDCKLIHCIMSQVGANEPGIESVEAGTDGGVRCEYIPGSRDIHGKIEGLLVIFHIGPSAFKHRECCVTLVQVTDLRREAQSSQQTPSANAEDDLLLQTHLGVSTIKLTGDSAVCRGVGKVVGVEKIQLCSSH